MPNRGKGKAPRVRVPKKLVEPAFAVGSICMDSGSDNDIGYSLSLTATRRPSLVQFRLDCNRVHPPGPIETPKGGFVNKCAPPPPRGILKMC